jgi:fucose 4-O-acetylase-like acetyltransferase
MQRLPSLDIAKGLAMLLVVIFHASQGLIVANMLPDSFGIRWVEKMAYGLHVQTFFLIAGYLSWPKIKNWQFQANRNVTLYWAYLLWASISAALSMFMPGANHASDINTLLALPFVPILHFWFLLALIAINLLLGLARNRIGLYLLGTVALVWSATMPDVNQIACFFPFAALGAILRDHGKLPAARALPALLCLLVLAFVSYLLATIQTDLNDIKRPEYIGVELGGIYFLYVLCEKIAQTRTLDRIGKGLGRIGEQSLTIYLSHGLFLVAARVVCKKILAGPLVGLQPMTWPLAVTAAIIGPLVMAQVLRRLNLSRLAGLEPMRLFGRAT